MSFSGSTKRAAPDSSSSSSDAQLIQQNRLRAKESIRQSASARRNESTKNSNSNSSGPTKNQIRLESSASNRRGADSTTVQQQGSSTNPRNANRPPQKPNDPLGNYIEYDLSKIHNSKGGFLVDEEEESRIKTKEELERERDRDRQRLRANEETGISYGADQPVCRDCGSPELNDQLRKVFKFYVCVKCEKKEIYSLLTKTEAKADYLLTDAELNDPDLLPHLLKRNPHKASYSNMMLYLRHQLESYAFSSHKWGSEENLDLEFQKREEKKKALSEKKFRKGLNDLRRRTRGNVWQKRKDEGLHEHRWLNHWVVYTAGNGGGEEGGELEIYGEEEWEQIKGEIGMNEEVRKKMLCQDCGQELEVEEF